MVVTCIEELVPKDFQRRITLKAFVNGLRYDCPEVAIYVFRRDKDWLIRNTFLVCESIVASCNSSAHGLEAKLLIFEKFFRYMKFK